MLQNQLKIAKIRLGQNFFSDLISVSTADGALLNIGLTYKSKFVVDEENAARVFTVNDFIGHACQNLCALIRGAASKFTFEQFHRNAMEIIRTACFVDMVDEIGPCRWFPTNRLCVFDMDVKNVVPVNTEVANLLSESIKSSMKIICKRLEQQAEIEAKKANMEGQNAIASLRARLIHLDNENFRLEKVERARICGLASVEKARFESEASMQLRQADAELEAARLTQVLDLLGRPGADSFLQLKEVEELRRVAQTWTVATTSDVAFPLDARRQELSGMLGRNPGPGTTAAGDANLLRMVVADAGVGAAAWRGTALRQDAQV